MKVRNKVIASAVAVMMMASAAPMTVSAASKAKAPAKVSITSVKRVNNTKANVKWKKLKKAPSGYAVYQKTGSKGWKLVKKAFKKSTSATISAGTEAKTQVKVRAYKNGKKVKKYYNKKAKKFVSKKAYKKLPKKNRAIKKVATVKWGKYSSVKTLNAVFTGKISGLKGSFDKNEDAAFTWNKVSGAKGYEIYRSEGGTYKKIGTVSSTNYTDKYYNPEKTIYYKVRPVNGTYTGSYSSVIKMRPQDITITLTKTVPKLICTICKEDVTELSDQELQEKHKIYFCSKCGQNSEAVSHSKEDIVKHIQENHKVDKDDNELPMVPIEDENSTDNSIAAQDDAGNNASYDAEVSELMANTAENGTKEIQAKHQHSWKKEAKTEKVVVGYKIVKESHTTCQVCNKDLEDWYTASKKYADEHGLTGTDIFSGTTNPVYKATIEAHIDKHLEEGAWNAGSTREDIVTVKKPIYGNVTVTTESCDCGASRIYK